MPALNQQLDINECPHCHVDMPSLNSQWSGQSASYDGGNPRFWRVYCCRRCGGLVTAFSHKDAGAVVEMYPASTEIDEAIPSPARDYLSQAIRSTHAPAGAVMLCASAVDAMLKANGYKDGVLNARIKDAAANHLITEEMSAWAHEVRLDANEPRHADDENPLPHAGDAQRSIEFCRALGEFLFVLPARVQRGRG